jgi:hypothetical protein
MTDREFIKKIKEELIDSYQYLDEEKQAAADMGELLGMVSLFLEMQGEGDEESEEH